MNYIKLLSILFCYFVCQNAFAQISIEDARQMEIGQTVTIQGIAISGAEFNKIRYIQDGTGGLGIYPGDDSVGDWETDIQRGDEVIVTGVLADFNGLLEINLITEYTVLSENNDLPIPIELTIDEIGESYESRLVQINNAVFDNAGDTFQGSVNYTILTDDGTINVRVNSNSPLIGNTIPISSINVIGVLSQYNDYQILVRDIEDLQLASDFYFTSLPEQKNITTNSFDIEWTTNVAGEGGGIRYGTTIGDWTSVEMFDNTSNFKINVSDLEPATFYYVQAFSSFEMEVVFSKIQLMSTASLSSGAIEIYFNHDVEEGFSNGSNANGDSYNELKDALLEKIDNANETIDLCIYNNDRNFIVDALSDAVDRGVKVRYIANEGTANNALQSTLPFPVIFVNQWNLMHNKFVIIDAENTDESWVITGSTNFTETNMENDFNNMIMIQDEALAKCYELEFNEIWGSAGDLPNESNSLYGDDKTNNTPHQFMIGGRLIENYFSPSDNVTAAIENAINTAETDLQFALLAFTKNELGWAVLNAHNDNVATRGILEAINVLESEYNYLLNNGVDIRPHSPSYQMHHKYAIIDATNPASDPIVITGSHNWSNSAEKENDENTLIIHDVDIANIYLQEFEARWAEVLTGIKTVDNIKGVQWETFPNPAIDYINIEIVSDWNEVANLTLWTIEGQLVYQKEIELAKGHQNTSIDLTKFTPSTYLAVLSIGDRQVIKKIQVQQ